MLGVVPFGLITGISAIEAGFDAVQTVAMSVLVFAGASQLALIELVGDGAPVAVVVATAAVVNLRYLMYSASIAPYFRDFSPPWKWLSAYALTDQSYAVAVTSFRDDEPSKHRRRWYYLGAAFALWGVWVVSTAVGVVIGGSVPPGLSLEFAVPLTFLALLVPSLKDRLSGLVGVIAGGVAIPAAALPLDLGLVAAALIGLTVGVLVDTFTDWADDEPAGETEGEP
ncbi:AzlC family ABC transporter permease [Haloarchaeobius litoreus]|uniref:AzlC family ABC transporter permease n=1 Tax=Haloarchaeobius litoreus TaxID=755306 RepID=A0ABD6DGR2_9EURY|nr:AzlC family ABC transporter permease [Haloarchaeobius litoreus]